MKITEKGIQGALRRSIMNSQQMICPNFSMPDWWECDLFSITKKGMVQEHEIKMTRKDFLKDAKKYKEINCEWVKGVGWEGEHVTKHELLAKGSEDGPSRFWFVCPKGIIKESETPKWAGLKYPYWQTRRDGSLILCIEKIKTAPLLHRGQVTQDVRDKVGQIFYFRYWDKIKEIESITQTALALARNHAKAERDKA